MMLNNTMKMKVTPFIAFLAAGGIAAVVNIVSRILLSYVMSYSGAIVIAYLFGMTTAYTLMRRFAFEKSGRQVSQEYVRFGLVNLLALLQIWAISVGLADYLLPRIWIFAHAELIAHAIGVLSPTVTSYFLHKYFTFSKT